MKLYTTNNYKGSHSAFGSNHPRVFEAPDEIFIKGMAHDKNTLAPIFGRLLPNNYANKAILNTEHYAGKPFIAHRRGDGTYPVKSASSNQMHPVGGSCAPQQIMLSGQTFLNGTVSPKKIWQSIKNPDLLYWEGAVGGYDPQSFGASGRNYTHGYYFVYEMNRKTLEIREYSTGWNVHHEDVYWFHEDDTYIYGMGTSTYPSWAASYMVTQLNKSNLALQARGFGRNDYINSMLLIQNEEFFTYSHRFRHQSYTGAAYIGRVSFSTLEAIGTSVSYTNSLNHKYLSSTPSINYPYLRMGLRAGGFNNHGMFQNGHEYSDGSIQSVHHDYGNIGYPAIVHDSALKAAGIMRLYNMFWDGTGSNELRIGRCNIDISGAKDEDPGFDFMPCTITSSKGITIPNKETFCGASGKYYTGSASNGYKGTAVRYFEDGTGSYLLVSGDYESNGTDGQQNAFWVFEITNHTASVTSNKAENDSLVLDLIQTVDMGYPSVNFFAPDRDHKKFIAMSRDSTSHKFFTWNSSTKQFTTASSINGEILRLATDSKGRIFSFHQDAQEDNIHLESLTLPNSVSVVMDQERYAYSGTTVNAVATVDVFNYQGTRLSKTVNLEILGTDAVFAGGGKTKTIQTSASNSSSVQIDISGPTFVRVNGTVSA